jgi:DNA-directed RNA polymerase subunit F
VLNYKKPKFWVIVFSVIIVTVIGIGLISNSKDDKAKKLEQIKPSLTPEVESIISDDYVNDMKCTNEDIEKLIEYGKIYGI